MKKNKHVLAVSKLNAFYGDAQILNEVTVSVESGEVVCLTGPNGSGKSTLLTLLAGLTHRNLSASSTDPSGVPTFDGIPLTTFTRKQTARHVGFLSQNENYAWNHSVRDVILTGRYSHTKNGLYTAEDFRIVEKKMEEVGISDLRDKKVFNLSGGEFQKVRITRALVQEPDFLLLDEPVANLDFGFQSRLLKELCTCAHNDGPGLIISIHELNTAARFADTIALLPKRQQCIVGTPDKIFQPEILRSAYKTDFGIFEHPAYHCPQIYTLQ
ncbi:MAG: ABC transporter ATP-binding protein [Treponema sp.]|jgi:iron complex transport system ATP-binding protein|nr:ABC transporter ATP-binding protein [Treponema sp.]